MGFLNRRKNTPEFYRGFRVQRPSRDVRTWTGFGQDHTLCSDTRLGLHLLIDSFLGETHEPAPHPVQ